MKKAFFIFCGFLFTIFLLAFTNNTGSALTDILEDKIKKEYFSETNSELLKTNLADVYSHEFDEILRVDLHKDASDNYYFVAYGIVDNSPKTAMINASDDMATQQFYPSRADMGIPSNAVVINCYCEGDKCTHDGKGKYCGIARDKMLPCQPEACPKKIDPSEIED